MGKRKNNKTTMPRVMTELYIILIGLAFGFGAEELSNNFSVELLLRFLALCAILLIWLHNQLKIGAYEGKNALFSVGELYFDTASAVFLVSASLNLDDLLIFITLISLSYVFDILVEALFLWETKDSKKEYEDGRSRAKSWISINLISIVAWVSFISCTKFSNLTISWIIFVIVLLGNIYDYRTHSDFYFRRNEQEDSNNE